MFSVTAPVPGRVRHLADSLYPELQGFDDVRDEHSCLVKRLNRPRGRSDSTQGRSDGRRPPDVHALQGRVHRALEGSPAVEAAVNRVEYFADPPVGSAPVVYLAVDSPGLETIHANLVDAFDTVEGLEGPQYVPHVTLARGGDVADAERLADRTIDRITWTVSELRFVDGRYRQPVSRVSLPA